MPNSTRRVVVAGNCAWNVLNFRAGLIRALKDNGYEPAVLAPRDAASEERIGELDVEWLPVSIDRAGLNPLADVRLLLQYHKLLKRLSPLAYLSFTIKPNIYGSLAAARLGIPAMPNVSGLGTVFIRRGPLQQAVVRLYRLAFRRARAVFFQNPDDLNLFVERRLVSSQQARLLPGSGVDLDRFTPVPLPSGPATFLFIGRLLGDKGLRELAAAARLLRSDRPDVRIQLLGPLDPGNRTAIASAELERWTAEGIVEYLGEAADVRPFLEKATAAVLPSYREGLPRSLLEAAAMGRPLVTTDVPGCREVVEDGVNGFLCAAHQSQSLAEAMRKLADLSQEGRSAMGNASRRMVEQRFSESVVIAAYLDALGEVGGSRS